MNKLKKSKIKYALFAFVLFIIFCYFSDLTTFMRYAFSANMQVFLDAKASNTDVSYTITYELNGGTQAEGQPTSGTFDTEVTLLKPTKENNMFLGWYDNAEFNGESITSLVNHTENITLYAKWKAYDYYIPEASFDGSNNTIINTGLYLYSAENIHKNFKISFDIDSYNSAYNDPNNVNTVNTYPTIISSMYEVASPYSGLVFRVVAQGGTSKYGLKINDSHVSSYSGFYDLQDGIHVEIIRENGVIYTKINRRIYTSVLTYADDIDVINVPLTIGGNINSSGAYDRFFDGQLSNVCAEFYEGNIIVDPGTGSTYTEIREEGKYQLDGVKQFNGTTDYIDTGINLFSPENIDKDFDIEFTVEEMGTNTAQATLVNAKDESNSNWPGFAYRYSGGKMTMTARWPGQTAVTNNDTESIPKLVKIYRRNNVIYYKIGNSEEVQLIETPSEALTSTFSPNLTFGASIDENGNPFRFFNGIVSDIKVEFVESAGTSSISPGTMSTNSLLLNIEPNNVLNVDEPEEVDTIDEPLDENTITNEVENVVDEDNEIENTIVENTIVNDIEEEFYTNIIENTITDNTVSETKKIDTEDNSVL